uniref:Uncharacterized protein n=1 Tax=Tetranychus urticae TaxID=32264 RepID=T1K242_TETUR
MEETAICLVTRLLFFLNEFVVNKYKAT